MNPTAQCIQELCNRHPKLLNKGGLCVGLVVTQAAIEKGLPLNPDSLLTAEGGQVAGLGSAAVHKILSSNGIERTLAKEGGRTNRGSLNLMKAYVAALNNLHNRGQASMEDAMSWWISKVRAHFASDGPRFRFDPSKSLRANIDDLLIQAREVQANAGGTNYVGAMLQHLIGAKLDLVLGTGKIQHHGFSVADASTKRLGDFQVDSVVFHVTTHPTEALVEKCGENLSDGLKPVILTLGDGLVGASFLLKGRALDDRVDVLDAAPFLTANVYERSFFDLQACKVTLAKLLTRYNEIVAACETDPALSIGFPKH